VAHLEAWIYTYSECFRGIMVYIIKNRLSYCDCVHSVTVLVLGKHIFFYCSWPSEYFNWSWTNTKCSQQAV